MMAARKRMMKCMMMGMHPHHGDVRGPRAFMKRMKPWLFDGPLTAVHFKEDDETITVYVAAPGLKKETLDIKAKASTIRISGEYQEEFADFGPEFLIQFEVPFDIDPDGGKAKYRDGMIILTFKRTAPPTKVEIE